MKECDVLGGQNILWILLHIFRGSGPPLHDVSTPERTVYPGMCCYYCRYVGWKL